MNWKNDFPTDKASIEERLNRIQPSEYARTRNHLRGAVSRLSPYITRGVITLPQILERVLSEHSFNSAYKFISELAWREFYQRVWWKLGDRIFDSVKGEQESVRHDQMIRSVAEASTGIEKLDQCVEELYSTGYMHNHARMWIAGLTCNMGRAYWKMPSCWLYYHLLDGDLASNTLSWQWVAGTFSHRKYWPQQGNINKFSDSRQKGTFLDHPYDTLKRKGVPEQLQDLCNFKPEPKLPASDDLELDLHLPLFLYHSWAVDPEWRASEKANRLLVLEPSHFEKFPVHREVLEFIVSLARKNIREIQVFVGNVEDLPGLQSFPGILSKSHPATLHFPGQKEEPEWMFPHVQQVPLTFTPFWKKCLPYLEGKGGMQGSLW